MDENLKFLVRIGKLFFADFHRGRPRSIIAPSMARHFTYEDADKLCQQLRSRGYDACVCDVQGRFATLEVIHQA